MPTTPTRSSLITSRQEAKLIRADRLLRDMHKVFSHDLPNQMVALQGLLQLLSEEETERLSNDGREYLRRLQNAARRASELIRFLKEMDRVNSFHAKLEPIKLSSLARELQGELKRTLPAADLSFEWHWPTPTVVADSRVVVQAILGLCLGLLPSSAKHGHVKAASQKVGALIELAFTVEGALQILSPKKAERFELLLARAWLELCDGDVELAFSGGEAARFSIVFPDR